MALRISLSQSPSRSRISAEAEMVAIFCVDHFLPEDWLIIRTEFSATQVSMRPWRVSLWSRAVSKTSKELLQVIRPKTPLRGVFAAKRKHLHLLSIFTWVISQRIPIKKEETKPVWAGNNVSTFCGRSWPVLPEADAKAEVLLVFIPQVEALSQKFPRNASKRNIYRTPYRRLAGSLGICWQKKNPITRARSMMVRFQAFLQKTVTIVHRL